MMATTYSDPNLAGYINAYFYPVKFDAEGKDTIEYLGQKYFPTSSAPRTPHPLAVKLLNNKLMYPTTLFLNGYDKDKKEFRLNMLASGYLETPKLEPMLIFSLENAFRNSNFDDFKAGFEKSFYDSTTAKLDKEMNWITPQKYFNGDSIKSKKTILLFTEGWCNSCRVMKQASFTDSTLSEYVKGKFNLIEFNPEVKDTLYYKGKAFMANFNQTPYHNLAFELTRGSFSFPTALFLDEKMNVIDAIGAYMNPGFLKLVAHFYGDDVYRTKSWKEFTEGH